MDAGADLISVHVEACRQLDRTIHTIKEKGVLAAAVLNPSTSLTALDYILPELDMVLLMGVNPGFGAQPFIPYTLQKIRDLRRMILQMDAQADIEIDGGVTFDNVRAILDAGANIIVTGSTVFRGDIAQNVNRFLKIMDDTYE